MDSFELNKITGAILGTCLFLMALSITAGAVFSPVNPAKPGFEIAVAEAPPSGEAPAAPAAPEPLEKIIANASVERGATVAKQCGVCHDFTKGGPNKIGPNLYGIVGRARATQPGFNYSAAMKAKGGTWTYDDLYTYLANPKAFVPGNNMAFAGLSKDTQRADVIDYLHTLSDNPQPLPTASN
jgi:cytochrome c